jgi:enoyl-CoA hydratase/carnithine racemase
VLLEGGDADVRVAHALEQSAFAGVFGSEESAEGMDAFLEKRDPKF